MPADKPNTNKKLAAGAVHVSPFRGISLANQRANEKVQQSGTHTPDNRILRERHDRGLRRTPDEREAKRSPNNGNESPPAAVVGEDSHAAIAPEDPEAVTANGGVPSETSNREDPADHQASSPPTPVPEGEEEETPPVNATLVEEGSISNEARQRIEEELRNKMIQDAVIGEAVPVNSKKKTRYTIAGILLLLVIIGGIVAGVIIGTRDDENADKVEGSILVDAPILDERDAPTDEGITSSVPSEAPTASTIPSQAPTTSNSYRDNSLLEEAQFLSLNSKDVLQAPVSSLYTTPQSFTLICHGAGPESREGGLWYTYTPKTTGPVTVISCGGPTKLEIYTKDEWDQLYCISNTADMHHRGDLHQCSGDAFSWEATKEIGYYILVLPFNATNVAADDDKFSIQIVDNDQCEHSHSPVLPTSAGKVLSYSTANADIDPGVPPCRGASESTSPGVWYQIKGTGAPITASTCTDNSMMIGFDTQISVFSGDDCGSLSCVIGNDDYSDCGTQSTAEWFSSLGETYYLLVHGHGNFSGTFSLKLTTDAQRPAHDFCETAVEVPRNGSSQYTVSLVGTTPDPDVPDCDTDIKMECSSGASSYPFGAWYSYEGTGSTMEFFWSDSSEHPLKMRVYSGGCGNLFCVEYRKGYSMSGAGGVDGPECGQSIYVDTVEGDMYYVLASAEKAESVGEEFWLEFNWQRK